MNTYELQVVHFLIGVFEKVSRRAILDTENVEKVWIFDFILLISYLISKLLGKYYI